MAVKSYDIVSATSTIARGIAGQKNARDYLKDIASANEVTEQKADTITLANGNRFQILPVTSI